MKLKKKRKPKIIYKFTDEFIEAEADALLQYMKTEKVIPFLKDFCVQRGYSSRTISERFVYNEKFAEVLALFKDYQEATLVKGAMTGTINYKFTIFTLKNVAGWRDVWDIKHDGKITFAALMQNLSQNGNEKGNGHVNRLESVAGSN